MRTSILCGVGLVFCGWSILGAEDPPRDWIEPATGHRVVRLSDRPGTASLYFHQNPYTASGDLMVVSTPDGLATIDLATRRTTPLVEGRASHVVVGKKTRQAFYIQNDTVNAVDLNTRVTRKILSHPRLRTGSGFGLNADETMLAGSFVIEDAPAFTPPANVAPPANPLATPPPTASSLEARWLARRPMALYTLNVKSGELNVIHKSTDWLNHVQMSPSDPTLIMFCHEGPWHKVDRIWTIRTDGSNRRLMHARTMDMEIAGHEFFGPDGKTIWYDLQTPKSKVFWLAGVDVDTGKTTRYSVDREHWSVHFNARLTARCSPATAEGRAVWRRRATGNGFTCSRRGRGKLAAERLVDLSEARLSARAERHLHPRRQVDRLPLEHARGDARVCGGSRQGEIAGFIAVIRKCKRLQSSPGHRPSLRHITPTRP